MRFQAALAAVSLLFTAVHAIVVTNPVAATVWDVTGAAPNYVQWSVYPLTFPTPKSQYFDIWLRNGVGAMYNPVLNVSIANNVDGLFPQAYVEIRNAHSFLPGPGYQLFFSDPDDANIIYCNSEIFSIGSTNIAAGAAPTSYDTQSLSQSSSTQSSSAFSSRGGASTSATSLTSSAISSMSTSSVVSSVPATTSAATTASDDIPEAPVIGGPADQNINLLTSAAGASLHVRPLELGSAVAGLAIVAAVMHIVA